MALSTALADGARESDLPPRESGRLLAARLFFAAPFHQVSDDLYRTVDQGKATTDRYWAVVEPHSRVSTNSYFGRFPASYWQRWTAATEVTLEATASGSGRLTVVASDAHGVTRVVGTAEVHDADAEQELTLTVPLDRFVDGGALWLELATQAETLTVGNARWSVAAPPRLRPTSVVICTFNRPDDCLHTLDVLSGDPDAMRMVDAVYVVDQGT
ncbi:MAG: glycosyltransferase, partial [Pseudonocardiaceae bacterium]